MYPPWDSNYTPLSPMATEALSHLRSYFDSDEPFAYNQANHVLQVHDVDLFLADDLFEMLLLRGYLYEVKDKLRITD